MAKRKDLDEIRAEKKWRRESAAKEKAKENEQLQAGAKRHQSNQNKAVNGKGTGTSSVSVSTGNLGNTTAPANKLTVMVGPKTVNVPKDKEMTFMSGTKTVTVSSKNSTNNISPVNQDERIKQGVAARRATNENLAVTKNRQITLENQKNQFYQDADNRVGLEDLGNVKHMSDQELLGKFNGIITGHTTGSREGLFDRFSRYVSGQKDEAGLHYSTDNSDFYHDLKLLYVLYNEAKTRDWSQYKDGDHIKNYFDSVGGQIEPMRSALSDTESLAKIDYNQKLLSDISKQANGYIGENGQTELKKKTDAVIRDTQNVINNSSDNIYKTATEKDSEGKTIIGRMKEQATGIQETAAKNAEIQEKQGIDSYGKYKASNKQTPGATLYGRLEKLYGGDSDKIHAGILDEATKAQSDYNSKKKEIEQLDADFAAGKIAPETYREKREKLFGEWNNIYDYYIDITPADNPEENPRNVYIDEKEGLRREIYSAMENQDAETYDSLLQEYRDRYGEEPDLSRKFLEFNEKADVQEPTRTVKNIYATEEETKKNAEKKAGYEAVAGNEDFEKTSDAAASDILKNNMISNVVRNPYDENAKASQGYSADDLALFIADNLMPGRIAVTVNPGIIDSAAASNIAQIIDAMTEQEKRTYLYLYQTEGADEAYEYWKIVQEDAAGRAAEKVRNDMSDDLGVAKVGGAFVAGLHGWASDMANLADVFTLNDAKTYDPFTTGVQQLVQLERESGHDVMSFMISLGQNMGNNLPSMVIGAATGGALSGAGAAANVVKLGQRIMASTAMYLSCLSNGYHEGINEGHTVGQSLAFGILDGMSEVFLENLLGGIETGIGKGVIWKSLEKTGAAAVIKKTFNNQIAKLASHPVAYGVAKTVGNAFVGGAQEFIEESIQQSTEPMIRNLTYGENNKYNYFTAENLEAGLSGFAMNFIMSFIGAGMSGNAEYRSAKQEAIAVQNAEQIMQKAPEYSGIGNVDSLVEDLSEKFSPEKISELWFAESRAQIATEYAEKYAGTEAGDAAEAVLALEGDEFTRDNQKYNDMIDAVDREEKLRYAEQSGNENLQQMAAEIRENGWTERKSYKNLVKAEQRHFENMMTAEDEVINLVNDGKATGTQSEKVISNMLDEYPGAGVLFVGAEMWNALQNSNRAAQIQAIRNAAVTTAVQSFWDGTIANGYIDSVALSKLMNDAKTREFLESYISMSTGERVNLDSGNKAAAFERVQQILNAQVQAGLIIAPRTRGAIDQKKVINNALKGINKSLKNEDLSRTQRAQLETQREFYEGLREKAENGQLNGRFGTGETTKQNSRNIMQRAGEEKVESKTKLKDDDTARAIVRRIAAANGRNVEFVSGLPEKAGGFVLSGNGTIYLSDELSATDSAMVTLVHELTHTTENSEIYKELSKNVLDSEAFKAWILAKPRSYDGNGMAVYYNSVNEYRADLEEAYNDFNAKHGYEQLDVEGIEKEMVAKFCGEVLFKDARSVRQLARQNRSLVRQILNVIHDFISRITGKSDVKTELRKLEKMYIQALDETRGETVEETRYSLKWTPSKAQKAKFARKMQEINAFVEANNIDQSSRSDSYYFTVGEQKYRVSNHSVEASNRGMYNFAGEKVRESYHPGGRESDVKYIHAGKTRIVDIYTDLMNGYELDGRGNRTGVKHKAVGEVVNPDEYFAKKAEQARQTQSADSEASRNRKFRDELYGIRKRDSLSFSEAKELYDAVKEKYPDLYEKEYEDRYGRIKQRFLYNIFKNTWKEERAYNFREYVANYPLEFQDYLESGDFQRDFDEYMKKPALDYYGKPLPENHKKNLEKFIKEQLDLWNEKGLLGIVTDGKESDAEHEKQGRDVQFNIDIGNNETDVEKAERLRNASITITDVEKTAETSEKVYAFNAKKMLVPLLEKAGIFDTNYHNIAVDVEFSYSKTGLYRSISHQAHDTDAGFDTFGLVNANIEGLIKNAYPIEAHKNEKKANSSIRQVITYGSILRTSTGLIPVKITVFNYYSEEKSKIHIMISEKERAFDQLAEKRLSTNPSADRSSSVISVPDYLRLVKDNPNFVKRIPVDLILGDGNTKFDLDVNPEENGEVHDEEFWRRISQKVKRDLGIGNEREEIKRRNMTPEDLATEGLLRALDEAVKEENARKRAARDYEDSLSEGVRFTENTAAKLGKEETLQEWQQRMDAEIEENDRELDEAEKYVVDPSHNPKYQNEAMSGYKNKDIHHIDPHDIEEVRSCLEGGVYSPNEYEDKYDEAEFARLAQKIGGQFKIKNTGLTSFYNQALEFNNDDMANGDPELREFLKHYVDDPKHRAQEIYTDAYKTAFADLKKVVVDECGIKAGTNEARFLQNLIEGKRIRRVGDIYLDIDQPNRLQESDYLKAYNKAVKDGIKLPTIADVVDRLSKKPKAGDKIFDFAKDENGEYLYTDGKTPRFIPMTERFDENTLSQYVDEETADNIIKAAEWYREQTEEMYHQINLAYSTIYPDRANAARERISKIEDRIERIKRYVNNFEEGQDFWRGKLAEYREQLKHMKEGSGNYVRKQNAIERAEGHIKDFRAEAEKRREQISELQAKIKTIYNEIDYLPRQQRLVHRENYVHHIKPGNKGLRSFADIWSNPEISSALAPMSEWTKPKSKWDGIFEAQGKLDYTEDAVASMMDYIPRWAHATSYDMFAAEMRGFISRLADATGVTKNANQYLVWLSDYVNDICGKTNPFDRGLQKLESRAFMKGLEKFNQRVKANAVALNIRSAVAQVFNIPNAKFYVQNPKVWALAYKNTLTMLMKKNTYMSELMSMSGYLNERYLSDIIDGYEEISGFKDKVLAAKDGFSSWLMSAGDKLGSYVMWDAALIDYINKNFGKSTELTEAQKREAVRYADDIARRSSAGRGIGEVPLTQKSKLVNLFAPFQVEVNNAFTVFWRNTISANGKRNIRGLTAFMISSAILNGIVNAVFGWGVTYDPIGAIKDTVMYWLGDDEDEEKTLFDKLRYTLQRNLGEFIENVPYAAILTQLFMDKETAQAIFGENDPTRFGTGQIGIRMWYNILKAAFDGDDVFWPTFDALINTLPPQGGRQMQRIIKGFFDVGGTIPGLNGKPQFSLEKGFYTSGTAGIPGKFSKNGFLLYSVNNDPADMIMTILFGSSYSRKGREYSASGRQTYSEKQTTVYKTLVQGGIAPNRAEEILTEIKEAMNAEAYDNEGESLSKNEKLRLYLDNNEDLNEEQKLDIFYMNQDKNSKIKKAIDEALEEGFPKEQLWNFIFNAEGIEYNPQFEGESDEEKQKRQLAALASTEAPENAKANAFYNLLATSEQKTEYDTYIEVGCTPQEAFEFTTKKTEKMNKKKLEALQNSEKLTEQEKTEYYMTNMATSTETSLLEALEQSGMSQKERAQISTALLNADRGDNDTLSKKEIVAAVTDAEGVSEKTKAAAIAELYPSQAEQLKTCTEEGITVKQYNDVKTFYDGASNQIVDGKTIKKQEQVANHINDMDLTPKQKTALWYAVGYKSKNLEKYCAWYDGEIYEDVGRADGSSINSEGGFTQKSSGTKKKSGSKKKSSGTKKRYSKAPKNPLSGMPGQRSSSSVKVIKHILPKAGQVGKITLPKV